MRRQGKQSMKRARCGELKRILEERRLDIISEVQDKMRDVRLERAAAPAPDVRDEAETSEAEIQGDLEFAVLQMKAETLNKIEEALSRLDDGTFGDCYECGKEIATGRLRALPFAVRCKDCEAAREVELERERLHDARYDAVSLFADLRG